MKLIVASSLLASLTLCFACSSDEEPAATSSSSGGAGSSGDVSSSSGGSSSGDVSSSSGGSSSGDVSSSSGGSSSSSGGGDQCSAARAEALQEQSTVSSAVVQTVQSDGEGGTLVYVDASAGGSQNAASSPRVYVTLGTTTRVEVSDVDAQTSTGWDLALKRTNVFTNSGVGGPGEGGAKRVDKAFADITAADAVDLATEAFFDEDCELLMKVLSDGVTEDPSTFRSTLAEWYDYNLQTHQVTPTDASFIVRAGSGGALYKVHFELYNSTPDGEPGETSGRYLLRVAPLE